MSRSAPLSGSGLTFKIHHFSRVSSTQSLAREFLDRGAEMGTVVVADEQDLGRGRRGRCWLSPLGGLYASVLLPAELLLPLRLGIAVASTLERLGIPATLKWPNDVLVRERKIAGILIEVVEETAIVGIGVNLQAIPVAGATSVAEEGFRAVDRDEFLDWVLTNLSCDGPERLLGRYRELSCTVGRIVRMEEEGDQPGPNRVLVGRACGVDASGRLLVEASGRVHTVAAGDCTHLVHETDARGLILDARTFGD